MKQNFTINDLVRFVFNETSNPEHDQLVDAMNADEELYAQYAELQSAKDMMPKAQFSPSAKAINNILRYSRETASEVFA